jgi:hypothetical protein
MQDKMQDRMHECFAADGFTDMQSERGPALSRRKFTVVGSEKLEVYCCGKCDNGGPPIPSAALQPL